MVKMVEACEETGLFKKDMLVALNFRLNVNCIEPRIVPAMQDKPEIKIAPVKDYIEGSRPAEPDWFGKNSQRNIYEGVMNWYLPTIEEGYSKMHPNQILCFVAFEGGYYCGLEGYVNWRCFRLFPACCC